MISPVARLRRHRHWKLNMRTFFQKVVVAELALCLFEFYGNGYASPNIAATSATSITHNGNITITGSGFGIKKSPRPLVWDNASGAKVSLLWDGYYPSSAPNPSFNLHYTQPIRGVPLPDHHVSSYLAGAHGNKAGAAGGWNVMLWKHVPVTTYPSFVYASWYQAADPAWVFGTGQPTDNNYKAFDYAGAGDPYSNPNWAVQYGPPHPDSAKDHPQWLIDTGNSLVMPDSNGHATWWNVGKSPMAGWARVEVALRLSPNSDGYIKLWEDGDLKVDFAGPTEPAKGVPYPWSGTMRSVSIGGYSRGDGGVGSGSEPKNWRYFSEIYLDDTLSRVVLANQPNLKSATVIEPQIPTSWGDGSITLSVNLGKFTDQQYAYLIVVDSNGNPSQGAKVLVSDKEGAVKSMAPPEPPVIK